MSDKKSMLRDAGILFAITLISGLILGFVYELTKGPIAEQEKKAAALACQKVFADAAYFSEYVPELSGETARELERLGVRPGVVFEASDESGRKLGYVIEMTSTQGYGGNISLYLGVTLSGHLNGISILKISETQGLGMRAEEVLVPQFAEQDAEEFCYTKTGSTAPEEIDAISGATITTKAVVNAVNGGLQVFWSELPKDTEEQ